jgi:hypothetical protein
MRTAPVDVLTQAEMLLEMGAAMAAVPTRSAETVTAKDLMADTETSVEIDKALRDERLRRTSGPRRFKCL